MSGDSVKPEKAAKVVPDSESQAPKKKKKKNAPDRPQPAWLFPPDEENPVLNPKPVDEQRVRKDQEEREQSIRFLKHKSVNAPMKPAPPTKLLTLIGVFLSSYGFNSTCRIFTLERNARKKLEGWEDQIGAKLDKGTPNLVKIYKEWFKEWQERRELEMTSSDEDDDAVTKRAKMAKKKLRLEDDKANGAEDTSSSGSDSSSDHGEGIATKMNGIIRSKASTDKVKATAMSSGSSSTSNSDSDADNEEGALAAKVPSTKSTVGNLVNKLKRKSSDSSSSTSSSESISETDSDSDASAPAKKKKKVDTVKKPAKATAAQEPPMVVLPEKPSKVSIEATKKSKKPIKSVAPQTSESSSSSSGTGSSSSESDAPAATKSKSQKSTSKPVPESKRPDQSNSADRKSSTDSSATLNGTTVKKGTFTSASTSGSSTSSSSSSVSSSPAPAVVPPPVSSPADVKSARKKRKRSQSPDAKPKVAKKINTPFSRIPQDVKIAEKLASNAYVPYDYAQKAHQDLIVTKGKGFTKEKNKKKRGA